MASQRPDTRSPVKQRRALPASIRYIVPYSKQTVDSDDIREVMQTLKSPFLTQGPKVKEFEHALVRYTGARYCVAFSSGTAALHGAYAAAGIGKGDEVITSPLTFAATANMIVALGGKPVFADIDSVTGNLDPKEVEKKITKWTKAIVPVDYAGLPVDLDAFRKLAKKHKLVLIEDSAQGLGATYKKNQLGTQADMTMFSFHPVKSITTGEGGAILTNNKKYYERLLAFRSHGLVKDRRNFKNKKFAEWHQEVHSLGFNYRLTDIQAALGVSQMRKLRSFIAKRTAAAKRYDALLKDVSHLTLPPARVKNATSAWHLYVVRVPSARRDNIFRRFRSQGLWVQVHYLPVYWHPYYQKLGYKKGACPNAEEFCASCISIPLFPGLDLALQRRVAQTLVTELETV